MTYKINGTTISLQPTKGQWLDRDEIGVDGNGHSVYSGVRKFEMKWDFMTISDFNQILTLYDAIGSTGTAVVELPQYNSSSWAFREYSGTVLKEPTADEYFEYHVSGVKLLVVKIRT